jgi:hypothetical protein
MSQPRIGECVAVVRGGAIAAASASRDCREAIVAFRKKRAAKFTGR